jgi:hypothetical protein
MVGCAQCTLMRQCFQHAALHLRNGEAGMGAANIRHHNLMKIFRHDLCLFLQL